MSIKKMSKYYISLILIPFTVIFLNSCGKTVEDARERTLFTSNWKFYLGDNNDLSKYNYDDKEWRVLNLPHDWSIEGEFRKDHPATPGGGALPGGIGWYRKSFKINNTEKNKVFFIDFDGVYENSEVWINGNYLGKRPNGYISFRYELTPFLNFGDSLNVIAVKVDNSNQPNSRWYSGSGIYRNVWLVSTSEVHIDNWGTYITTSEITEKSASVIVKNKVLNSSEKAQLVKLETTIFSKDGKKITSSQSESKIEANSFYEFSQNMSVVNPSLWSDLSPYLYTSKSVVYSNGKIIDNLETKFGIRDFEFSAEKGFILNGVQSKIKGVCLHHDLGCLGTAVNKRAIERQLEILKKMGCNGVRTSHNVPTPELLDLCDEMGFIVMDEIFDIWSMKKSEYDYAQYWNEWHVKDLEDFILRDRNHASIFMWSIGNEVLEQFDHNDPLGANIALELSEIVRNLDSTRAITAGCNEKTPENPVIKSGALDVVGYNYGHELYEDIPNVYPGQPFIATESESSLHTRGSYDMPSDSVKIWPHSWDQIFLDGNKDFTCSAYDNCRVPWGSTHEETWKIVKNNDFISGMYTWTGFDYLGEPTPYPWPARSSYFGLIDLAGFPKDAYYFYQSEWTDEPMLHLFPHWNWEEGKIVDVWAYSNCDEVELFVNGKSLGAKSKTEDLLHMQWRVEFVPGTIKAIARKNGEDLITKTIKTAGKPATIKLSADRSTINSDGKDLSFITVSIFDEEGNIVPKANNLINFEIIGDGKLVGVDNGLQTSHQSFKEKYCNTFNGLCLAVLQSTIKSGEIILKASSEGLESAQLKIETK